MSLKYEVRNAFTSPDGSFSAGDVIPAGKVKGWATETLNNRIVNGDIVPVASVEEEVVEEEVVEEEVPESTKKNTASNRNR